MDPSDFVQKKLSELYQEPGAHLAVVFGARQVGKTTAIHAWLARFTGKKAVVGAESTSDDRISSPGEEGQQAGRTFYWAAPHSSAANQLRSLAQAWFAFLQPAARVDPSLSYGSWARFWDEVALATQGERVVVVLDDFFHVLAADPTTGAALRNAWDSRFRGKSQAVVVLAGTPQGPGQWADLRTPNPLFRRANLIPVTPLPYPALSAWFPGAPAEERLAAYGFTGGRPGLLAHWTTGAVSSSESVEANLSFLLAPLGPLRSLVELELLEQFGTPRNYVALLEALARGQDSVSTMARAAGIARSNVLKYAGVLQALGWVSRDVPVTVRQPEKSRKGRYQITDGALHAYFALLANRSKKSPEVHSSRVPALRPGATTEGLPWQAFLNQQVFTAVCRAWVAAQKESGSGGYERVGAAWDSHDRLEVAAVDFRRRRFLVGGCFGPEERVEAAQVDELVARGVRLSPGEEWTILPVIFARGDVSAAARTAAQVVHLDEM